MQPMTMMRNALVRGFCGCTLGTCFNLSCELPPYLKCIVQDANVTLRRVQRKAAAVWLCIKLPIKQVSSTGRNMPLLWLARNLVLHDIGRRNEIAS